MIIVEKNLTSDEVIVFLEKRRKSAAITALVLLLVSYILYTGSFDLTVSTYSGFTGHLGWYIPFPWG